MLCEEALNSNCGIQSKLSADLEGVWVTMHGNLACMRNVKNSASNLVKLGQWAVSGLQTISFDANTVIGLKGKRVVEGPSILSKALLENISGGGQIHASGSKWKRRARYRILTNKGRGSKEVGGKRERLSVPLEDASNNKKLKRMIAVVEVVAYA
ncbi:hypothetical protein ACOSP7_028450 [Xanthoceras sorbifolium]